jgi:hypothetical protein
VHPISQRGVKIPHFLNLFRGTSRLKFLFLSPLLFSGCACYYNGFHSKPHVEFSLAIGGGVNCGQPITRPPRLDGKIILLMKDFKHDDILDKNDTVINFIRSAGKCSFTSNDSNVAMEGGSSYLRFVRFEIIKQIPLENTEGLRDSRDLSTCWRLQAKFRVDKIDSQDTVSIIFNSDSPNFDDEFKDYFGALCKAQ